MTEIKEWLRLIDRADRECSPSKRASYADCLVEELRDIFGNDLEILQKLRSGELVEVVLDKEKIKIVENMINKECQRSSLVDLCEYWGITVDEFYAYQYGERMDGRKEK